MCLAVPRRVVKIKDNQALLQDNRWVRLDIVPDVVAGDYVIVSADLAVEKISEKEAISMSELLNEK